MPNTNQNDSAFPVGAMHGLTKREYFAAAALQGILAFDANDDRIFPLVDAAEQAVTVADLLIDQLNYQPREDDDDID